jgi:hypothetical protein
MREIHAAIVPQRERPLVQDTQKELPQSIRGLFDFVEEHQRALVLVRVVLFQDFLSDQRLGLAVTEIPWRRANELGDLVAVLKLRTVSLHHGTHVAEEDFRRRFHQAGFAGPRRPQEE